MMRRRMTAIWLSAALIAGSAWASAPVIIDGALISKDEPPPHGEVGMSTARAFTSKVAKPNVEIRERILHKGAQIGQHVLTHDQIFYLVSGEAEFITDGRTHILKPGDMAYAYDDSSVFIRQRGEVSARVLMAWPARDQLPKPASTQVVDEADKAKDEPTPHGFVGMTRVYSLFEPSPDRKIDLRKRVYMPGAKLGTHITPRDLIFYINEGEGVLITDGTKTALRPGRALYVFNGTEISLEQTGATPLSLMMVWPAAGLDTKPQASIVVSEAGIGKDEPPHGGVGMSTVYRLTDTVDERTVELRKRVLKPGAVMAPYSIPRDQAFYVLDGEGVLMTDGKTQTLQTGQMAYLYQGTNFSLTQKGDQPLSVMMIWPLAPKIGLRQ